MLLSLTHFPRSNISPGDCSSTALSNPQTLLPNDLPFLPLYFKENFGHFLQGYCELLEVLNTYHFIQFRHDSQQCSQRSYHRPFPFFLLSHPALLIFQAPHLYCQLNKRCQLKCQFKCMSSSAHTKRSHIHLRVLLPFTFLILSRVNSRPLSLVSSSATYSRNLCSVDNYVHIFSQLSSSK